MVPEGQIRIYHCFFVDLECSVEQLPKTMRVSPERLAISLSSFVEELEELGKGSLLAKSFQKDVQNSIWVLAVMLWKESNFFPGTTIQMRGDEIKLLTLRCLPHIDSFP